jgi:hypothetical protein
MLPTIGTASRSVNVRIPVSTRDHVGGFELSYFSDKKAAYRPQGSAHPEYTVANSIHVSNTEKDLIKIV